jgi:hypothetical protein
MKITNKSGYFMAVHHYRWFRYGWFNYDEDHSRKFYNILIKYIFMHTRK